MNNKNKERKYRTWQKTNSEGNISKQKISETERNRE
jgi:hypothetical protein